MKDLVVFVFFPKECIGPSHQSCGSLSGGMLLYGIATRCAPILTTCDSQLTQNTVGYIPHTPPNTTHIRLGLRLPGASDETNVNSNCGKENK